MLVREKARATVVEKGKDLGRQDMVDEHNVS